MSFDLLAIGVFGALGLAYAWLAPPKTRGWFLLVASLVAIYWLQPALPIRFSDYVLPSLTVLLAVAGWAATRPAEPELRATSRRDDRLTLAVVAATVVGLSFFRYVNADFRLTASRPPAPLAVLVVLAAVGTVAVIAGRLGGRRRVDPANRRRWLTAFILLIVALFVILKTPALGAAASGWWRARTGQDTTLANGLDLGWLGFSYVAFRLIHTLRDRQTGLLPDLSLREYLTYVIFFPAYTAGPIDRAERFAADLRGLPAMQGADPNRLALAGRRLLLGLLKKFIIADTLAHGLSLNAASAAQGQSTGWLWLLLYGYALRLYLDFAGYTDIAIGIGQLFGIRLPENFTRPYQTTSLTAFWQSWHITLSNWARFYVFTPLSRWLLTRRPRPPAALIVLAAQLATMITIGLWHGVTWNFLVWGLWHGLGLFAHKQWSDRTRKWYRRLQQRPRQRLAWRLSAWALTFHYVVLGWVWFALPDLPASLDTFGRLFGLT